MVFMNTVNFCHSIFNFDQLVSRVAGVLGNAIDGPWVRFLVCTNICMMSMNDCVFICVIIKHILVSILAPISFKQIICS